MLEVKSGKYGFRTEYSKTHLYVFFGDSLKELVALSSRMSFRGLSTGTLTTPESYRFKPVVPAVMDL